MKKFICMSLTFIMVMTSGLAIGFAKGDSETSNELQTQLSEKQDKLKDLKEDVKDLEKDLKDLEKEINSLKKDLAEQHKDKTKRKDLIKKISKLKKQHNKNSIPLFINGNELNSDVTPIIRDGRTLIPVRAVANSLGAEVHWDAANKTITVTNAVYGSVYESVYNPISSIKTTIVLTLNSNVVTVNGNNVTIDVPAQIESNRTMVPLRFISELLKKSVEWDSETGSITIEDEDGQQIDIDDVKKYEDGPKDHKELKKPEAPKPPKEPKGQKGPKDHKGPRD